MNSAVTPEFARELSRVQTTLTGCDGDRLTVRVTRTLNVSLPVALSLLTVPEYVKLWDQMFVNQEIVTGNLQKRVMSLWRVLLLPEILGRRLCPDIDVYFTERQFGDGAIGSIVKRVGVRRPDALDLHEATCVLLPKSVNAISATGQCEFTFLLSFTRPGLGGSVPGLRSIVERGVHRWVNSYVEYCQTRFSRASAGKQTYL
jgi:hypothetical protein